MIRQQPRKNANFASGDLSEDRKSSETSARNRVKIDSDAIFSQLAALLACWVPPPMEQSRLGMQITVLMSFKRNGELFG